MKILLKNAQIVSDKKIETKDVLIQDGIIAKIKGTINIKADAEYDLTGKYLLPGCIDAHVHFRTPGHEDKEDWKTGSRAALAGGFTTVFDMPNTNPHTSTVKALNAKRGIIERDTLVNYGLYFEGNEDNIEECKKAEGIVGFKVYMGATTGRLAKDDDKSGDVLENLFKNTDKLVAVHAEDESLMKKHADTYRGDNTPEVHSLIRSDEIAVAAAKKAVHIAKKLDGRLHLCHMSTKKEVELMRKFGDKRITCEVAPHHLFLAIRDYVKLGNFIKVNPPVRGQHDQDVLWKAINEGIVTIIASDHAPHLKAEKQLRYADAPSGIPELDTSLALMLDAVNDERISLEKVVELMCVKPAEIFGIKGKGLVKKGYDADLTVVDMGFKREVEAKNLYTKCGWSPYEGRRLKGWPVMTFVNGVLGMKDGKIIESPDLKGKEVELN